MLQMLEIELHVECSETIYTHTHTHTGAAVGKTNRITPVKSFYTRT